MQRKVIKKKENVAAQKKSCNILHVCRVTSTEVEMVRPSWCVSGRIWGQRMCKIKVLLQLHNEPMAKVGEWLLVAGDTQHLLSKVFCRQDKNTLLRSTGRQRDLTFVSVQLGPWTAGSYHNHCLLVLFFLSPSLFLSRSACVGSRSSGCRPPGRWRWGRCNPAWRRARWRK